MLGPLEFWVFPMLLLLGAGLMLCVVEICGPRNTVPRAICQVIAEETT